MKQISDSDFDPAMLASIAFEAIIDRIQNSNLNFQLQMTPFSAQISLKKSLVIDKSGVPRKPSTNAVNDITTKNMKLEKDVEKLQISYARAVDDCDDAYKKIRYLQTELERISMKHEDHGNLAIETLQHKVNTLNVENINLNETIRRQLEEISDLETSSNIKTETSKKLNKRLSELKEKTEKEKAATIKSFKAEIKSWRKELGEERREKIKLEEKLKKFVSEHQNKDINKKCSKKVTSEPVIPVPEPETLCSRCSNTILDYVPEYFRWEKYNPACQDCKSSDSSWDPDDPFSAFPTPSQPVSLASHWMLPPSQLSLQNPHSIVSLISHYQKPLSPDQDDEEKTDFKKWIEDFREQLRADRAKIIDEIKQEFRWFKES